MRRLGLALALAAAISGCGGGEAVSRADYIAAATRVICTEYGPRGNAVADRLDDLDDEAHSSKELLAKAVPVYEEGLGIQRDQLAALREIEPPEADRATIDKLLAEVEQENDLIGDVLAAARDRDVDRYVASAEELSDTEARIGEMLDDFGFQQCQDAP